MEGTDHLSGLQRRPLVKDVGLCYPAQGLHHELVKDFRPRHENRDLGRLPLLREDLDLCYRAWSALPRSRRVVTALVHEFLDEALAIEDEALA